MRQVQSKNRADYLTRFLAMKPSSSQRRSSLPGDVVFIPEWDEGVSAFTLMKSSVLVSIHLRLPAWPSAKPKVLDLL